MAPACGHRLCALLGGACSLVAGVSHGSHAALRTRTTIAPDVFDEVRGLLPAIDVDHAGELGPGPARDAAARLAAIVRREGREGRSVLAQARLDEPDLVPRLERLCARSDRSVRG
jgi:hypothetical protein